MNRVVIEENSLNIELASNPCIECILAYGGGYNPLLTVLWAESNSPLHRERIECSTQSVVSILGEGLARREEVRQDAFYRVHSHPQSVALGIQLVLPAKIKQRLDSRTSCENDK